MYRPKGVVFGLIWSGKGNRICLRNLEKSTIFADSVNHRHFSYFALRFLSRVVASLRRFSEKNDFVLSGAFAVMRVSYNNSNNNKLYLERRVTLVT